MTADPKLVFGKGQHTTVDPEIVARIQARARADRAIVDRYNAKILRDQGVEPTPERLQEMCGQNIGAALVAEAEKKRQASNE